MIKIHFLHHQFEFWWCQHFKFELVKKKCAARSSRTVSIITMSRLTSAFRSDRIRTMHLFTAIWKVKLITPLIFSRASSHRLLRLWRGPKQTFTLNLRTLLFIIQRLVASSLLTQSSSPSMWRITVLALLLPEPRKNWALRRLLTTSSAASESASQVACRSS